MMRIKKYALRRSTIRLSLQLLPTNEIAKEAYWLVDQNLQQFDFQILLKKFQLSSMIILQKVLWNQICCFRPHLMLYSLKFDFIHFNEVTKLVIDVW